MPAVSFAAGPTAARRAAKQDGTIKGKAKDAKGAYLPSSKVRVRNASTGAIAAETTTDSVGDFLATVPPGNYIVEVVDASGTVLGLSPTIAVTAGATATVTVTATAAGVAAAGATGAGFALFGLGTVATIGVIAGATTAGVVTYEATKTKATATGTVASPSR
jgi:hypothetical protein